MLSSGRGSDGNTGYMCIVHPCGGVTTSPRDFRHTARMAATPRPPAAQIEISPRTVRPPDSFFLSATGFGQLHHDAATGRGDRVTGLLDEPLRRAWTGRSTPARHPARAAPCSSTRTPGPAGAPAPPTRAPRESRRKSKTCRLRPFRANSRAPRTSAPSADHRPPLTQSTAAVSASMKYASSDTECAAVGLSARGPALWSAWASSRKCRMAAFSPFEYVM